MKITDYELLQEKVKVYCSVIQSASANGLSKNEVAKIAGQIWEAIIKPSSEKQKDIPQGAAPSVGS